MRQFHVSELEICRHVVIIGIFGKIDIACKWYQYHQCAAKITMPIRRNSASQALLQIQTVDLLIPWCKNNGHIGCRVLNLVSNLGYLEIIHPRIASVNYVHRIRKLKFASLAS